MRAIDRKGYHSETLSLLEALKQCDSFRTGYYTDLANKWSIEDRLGEWIASLSNNKSNTLKLSSLQLVDLHYKQYLCVADEIDLKDNRFDEKKARQFSKLFKDCNVKLVWD